MITRFSLTAYFWALSVFMTPLVTYAGLLQDMDAGQLGTAVGGLTTGIAGILVPLLLIMSFVAFLWGVFLYFFAGAGNEEKRATGRIYMIYAIMGFVFIATIWALVFFVTDTIGFGNTSSEPAIKPFVPGS